MLAVHGHIALGFVLNVAGELSKINSEIQVLNCEFMKWSCSKWDL